MGAKMLALQKEKVGKLLVKYALPIILSFLINELYAMVDTFFVGKYVGDLAMGSVLIIYPLQRIFNAVGIMIAIGTATKISNALGRGEIKDVEGLIGKAVTLNFMVLLPVIGLISFFPEKVLYLIGATGDLVPQALTYLRIVVIGFFFTMNTVFFANVLLAFGNQKVSMLSTLLGAALNLVIDYLLIVGFSMGVKGAAIATVVSQIAGFGLTAVIFNHYRSEYGLKLSFGLDFVLFRSILLVGASAFIIEAEDGVLMTVLNHLMSGTVGEAGIVVLGISTKIYMFLFITVCGIASAMQPICSYNAGAKNYERIADVLKKTIRYTLASSLVIWVLCMVFARQIVSLMITDAALVDQAVVAFRTMILLYPLISVYYCSIYYFQAVGKSKRSVILAICRQTLLLLPISVLMVKVLGFGEMGVYLAYPIADIISSLISFALIKKGKVELEEKLVLVRKYA